MLSLEVCNFPILAYSVQMPFQTTMFMVIFSLLNIDSQFGPATGNKHLMNSKCPQMSCRRRRDATMRPRPEPAATLVRDVHK